MLKTWVVVLVGKKGMLTSLLWDVSLIPLFNCKIGVFYQACRNWNLKLLPKKDAKDKTLHLTKEWAERQRTLPGLEQAGTSHPPSHKALKPLLWPELNKKPSVTENRDSGHLELTHPPPRKDG